MTQSHSSERPLLTLHRRRDLGAQIEMDPSLLSVLEAFKQRLSAVVSGTNPDYPQLILTDSRYFKAVFRWLKERGFAWLHSPDDRIPRRTPHEPDSFFLSEVVGEREFNGWLPYIGDQLPNQSFGHWSAEMLNLGSDIRTLRSCLIGFELLVRGSELIFWTGPVEDSSLQHSSVLIPSQVRSLGTGWQAVVFKSKLQ